MPSLIGSILRKRDELNQQLEDGIRCCGCETDLVVEFQVGARVVVQEVGGHVRRKQIEEDPPVALLQRVHFLFLLFRLKTDPDAL